MAHGDVFEDPYEWMRERDSPQVREYAKAQNRYCEQRTARLSGLRHTLFDELKSHVQETDMSVPTRIHRYWYFTRMQEGSQYPIQCRVPVKGGNDWEPPRIDEAGSPGTLPAEEIIFDANRESRGHDFFRVGGMDLSADGRWLLYGIDVKGNERYDFHIRDLTTGAEQPEGEILRGIASACFTPDGRWVFYTVLDGAWRPCAVRRHQVGTDPELDEEVFHEQDERFWVGAGLSFDETRMVIGTSSKTTSEVLLLNVDDPTGVFRAFIPSQEGVEYDVGFSRFEDAPGEDASGSGRDLPVAVVCHNLNDPNFQIDVIDMNSHTPPYSLGEGEHIAFGSPYGCEQGDGFEPGASKQPIDTAYTNPVNPAILRGAHGLQIEGMSMYRNFVCLGYRADGLPHLAAMTKRRALDDLLHHRPWSFREITPPALPPDPGSHGDGDSTFPDGHLYAIAGDGNPSYDAPAMRYSFASYTRPAELHEIEPSQWRDRLLKRAHVRGDFDPRRYAERRIWVPARDGQRIPVSLVWRSNLHVDEREPAALGRPMFITGYGAYEISSDPGFSTARLSLLDRGVLYAVVHVRGGGEMGRAWYEQGRRMNKRHTFEDFIDATAAVQDGGLADVGRTVANGGSAGGLLMGAVANMAPERYAGIEADVPFVDALTTILDPSLPLTVTEWDEWGDPLHDRSAYEYMRSYSPYENAPSDERPAAGRFPRILITTSMHDTRVLVAEPLKWLARLQSAQVDAMAKIEVDAGHGGTSGRYRQWEEVCFENAWCLDVMHATGLLPGRQSAGIKEGA